MTSTARGAQSFKVDAGDERRVRELIRLTRDGDERAFGQLVDKYRNQVAALAYRMVGDYDEAADITQNEMRLHFGLADATAIDRITVHWPSGIMDEWTNLAADQFLRLEEGESSP